MYDMTASELAAEDATLFAQHCQQQEDEWSGVHEQIAAELMTECGTQPVYGLMPVRGADGRFGWGIREVYMP